MAKMNKMSLIEMENVLLDQIEKLSDDSIGEDASATELIVNRSKAISALASNVIQINTLKLDMVKELSNNGGIYGEVLGIEG